MAIGVIATLKIQDGKNADFEAAFRELSAGVRANEPGNKLYQLFKSSADANTYVVMEIYADAAAMEAHGKSDHFRASGAKLGPTLAGRPEIQRFESV